MASSQDEPSQQPFGSSEPIVSSHNLQRRKKPNADDFIFGKILGEGSFSTVYLAKEKTSQRQYAIKVLSKNHMKKERKVEYVMREKKVLELLGQNEHPFFVKLAATFQDPTRLFFVLSFEPNGELLDYINRLSAFDMKSSQFYTSEIVLALEHLHNHNIVHRDLKPENILLSKEMHIRITDFGSARMLDDNSKTKPDPKTLGETGKATDPKSAAQDERRNKRRSSFVGTAQFVSPEVLNGEQVSTSCDLWALGCILYQFISGEHPFRGANEYQIFNKITKLDYEWPEGFDPAGRDLVEKLLLLKADERLGSPAVGGYDKLKSHKFFEGVDWEALPTSTPPKLVPYLPALENHNTDLWSDLDQTGLDDSQMVRLMAMDLNDETKVPSDNGEGIETQFPELLLSTEEKSKLIGHQALNNDYHQFVEGNLIIHQGLLDKRKGLFARRRMFLMTEGPHLYYVDPVSMVKKGEIPWSRSVRPEAKNFKVFFVHTPNRTYYLEDPVGYGQIWCQKIQELWKFYYGPRKPKFKK